MLTRIEQRLLATLALLAMLALVSAPVTHDHVGKSACHVCSTVENMIWAAVALLSTPALRLLGTLPPTAPHAPSSCVVSLRIPRAPPA